jgi:mRNA interferase RelE/StbE
MDWTVRVLNSADREIRQLPSAGLKEEALDCLEHLGADPFPEGHLKLRGYPNRYRIRFGDNRYRIVYTVSRRDRIVTVFRVRPRSLAYRGMRNP